MKWLLQLEKTKRRKGKESLFTRALRKKPHSIFILFILLVSQAECRSNDTTAALYFDAGVELMNQGRLDSAYLAFLKSQEIYSNTRDTVGLADVLLKLGVVHEHLGNRESARNHFLESAGYSMAIGDTGRLVDCYINLGGSYTYQKRLDSADYYFNLAKESLRNQDLPDKESNLLNNWGVLFLEQDEPDAALELFKEVVRIKTDSGDSLGRVAAVLNIGVVYLDQDNFDSSLIYLSDALEQSRSLNITDYERFALVNLGNLHYNFRQFEQAVDLYDEYHSLKDSLYSAQMLGKIEQLQLDYDLAQQNLLLKQSELKSAQRSKWFIGIASFLLLAVITVVLIYYRRISVHRAREGALMEARESENKRISDLLWKEIGSAVREKKLVLPGVELPEQSIGGAIEAAKFMANHQYNPFLQISLTRAVQHLMNNLTEDKPFEFSLEADEIQLEKSEKLAVYRVIESLLVDAAENQRSGIILVRLKVEASKLTIYIKSEKTNEKKTMMYRSAEARVDQLRGKIQRSNKGEFQQSEVLIPLN